MATRAERFRAAEERSARETAKKGQREEQPLPQPTHADKKATYAREEHSPNTRPSRKSTRGSDNRAKNDAPLLISHERARSQPDARFAADQAKAIRVRGKRADGAS